MIQVDHYGLQFTPSGVGILVQGGGAVQHALDVTATFPVKLAKGLRAASCPHEIDISTAMAVEMPLLTELERLMMPVPKDSHATPTFMEDTRNNQLVVSELMRLSSPGGQARLKPLFMNTTEGFMKMLRLTNVQPLVLYGYRDTYQRALMKILEAALFQPRRLIVLLPPLVLSTKQTTPVTTDLDPEVLKGLPLETLGAGYLRHHMLSKGHQT